LVDVGPAAKTKGGKMKLIAFALTLFLITAPQPGKRVVVIAHRAAHEEAPENSLAAIRAAITAGCDYVEMDVRGTKDGALVLMHDGAVNRTTDGSGEVAAMTLEEGARRGASVRNFGMLWPIGQPAGPRYALARRSREELAPFPHTHLIPTVAELPALLGL
jgi:glycerophosphoryl diester phosphodiesterase